MNYGTILKHPHPQSAEILECRTECSKTFRNPDGTNTWTGKIGAVHYKENYDDDHAPWLEIDTTPVHLGDRIIVERTPMITTVFLDRVGYQVQSRQSGHIFRVELESIDGIKLSKVPPPILSSGLVRFPGVALDFDVYIFDSMVRLWKTAKSENAATRFLWRVWEEKPTGSHSLMFRETPEAFDAVGSAVELATKKRVTMDGFTWEERITSKAFEKPQDPGEIASKETTLVYPLRIDTDVNEQVGASADDGWWRPGTSFSTAYARMNLGTNGGAQYHTFYRWTGVTISGDTVSSASIELYAEIASWTNAPETKIAFVDEDNPAAPTNYTEADADPLTTAQVDWDDSLWSADTWNESPDLVTPVQELVDSYTISNDAIMAQVKNDGGTSPVGLHYPAGYPKGSSYAAKLTIVYTVGDVFIPKVSMF